MGIISSISTSVRGDIPSSTQWSQPPVPTASETLTAVATVATSVRDGGIGAAVGVVVGILLGAASMWYYFQRPVPVTTLGPNDFNHAKMIVGAGVHVQPPKPKEKLTRNAVLDFYQLDGPDCLVGRTIPNKVGEISAGTTRHVDYYYHLDKVSSLPDNFDEALSRFVPDEKEAATLKALLIDPFSRDLAICHLIARAFWTNLDVHSVGPLSLLPPTVTEFMTSLPFSYETAAPEGSLSPPIYSNLNFANEQWGFSGRQGLIAWRTVTAFLMKHDYFLAGPLKPPPSIEPQMKKLVAAISDVLAPFARDDMPEDCPCDYIHHLETGLGNRYLELGYQIFSNPLEFHFVFEPAPSMETGLVTAPGLAVLSSWYGEPLDRPGMVDGYPLIQVPRVKVILGPGDNYEEKMKEGDRLVAERLKELEEQRLKAEHEEPPEEEETGLHNNCLVYR
ncbi:hypothetical protein VFPPC_11701 [Pochonia chlamydosporia 170]|uniref:Uncharacterized protein n=1 Tax=Pochonia chlamydosporia 170 TaxID=1380566 RepID=A0A179FVG2_METCM|nr:hypothetical protein VFPPC_11701 [Pochonia chlamydosporia 170]OAQ69646.1 hypothetical protein VFPPC_11701 [Pochonia chlamydosporia 170]